MGSEKKQGRPTIHDEPLEPAATRLPAAVIKWLLGKRNPNNVSDALRQQLMDDYNAENSKNETTDD